MGTDDVSTGKKKEEGPLARRLFLRRAAVAGAALLGLPRTTSGSTEVWEEGDPKCQVQVPEVKPAYSVDAQLLGNFVKLSETLTGVSPLDRQLANRYLKRFTSHPQLTSVLPELIKAYREIAPGNAPPTDADVDRRIMQDPKLRVGAEQVIYLWYVSAFFLPRADDPTKSVWIYGSPEAYQQALLWSVIRAHAPMTPGGPYGYWADAPSV
jgi:hypothetical protein